MQGAAHTEFWNVLKYVLTYGSKAGRLNRLQRGIVKKNHHGFTSICFPFAL